MREDFNKDIDTCIKEGKNLLNRDSYIVKSNYKNYLDRYMDIFNNISLIDDNNPYKQDLINLSSNIDDIIEKHNLIYLETKSVEYKDYFDDLYKDIDPNIILDKEQIKAILSDDDYSLIIAGAGTGKTTTMASKVKYLVDIKKVDPSKIIVMSYTRKATEELAKRIQIDFDIPANVTTFHSLGMMHIREIFKNRKCYVVDENTREKIFREYFEECIFPYKQRINDILENFSVIKELTTYNFIFSKHFLNNNANFNSYKEYFEYYKTYKIQNSGNLEEIVETKIEELLNKEYAITIKGEIMKSRGEAIIANFLYRNNIGYYYEKIYKELLDNNVAYRPDFTLEIDGEKVYIEYFGLSTYKSDQNSRYEKIKRLKEEYHKKHNTKFIKIDYMPGENILETLKNELIKLGFELKPRNYEEIYDRLLDNNPLSQIFPYKNFLYQIIDTIKSSSKRQDYFKIATDYINKLPEHQKEQGKIQLKYIHDFYSYYQKKLYNIEEYGFDFSDMIYYANLYIDKIGINNNLNFDYLIIDEYQDISQERYEFAKNIANRNNAKVVAVGDDWQSIFAFAGSRIKYIYNFQKYFEDAKLLKINQTYRNSQNLIDYSAKFIMKNQEQINKELISSKNIRNPIKFVPFEEGNEYQVLKELILQIHRQNPTHSIMILGRTNKIINDCFNEPELKDDIGTKIQYIGYEDIDIDGMTIHKAKGLTSDEVIIIGLDKNFPLHEKDMFWLEYLLKSFPEREAIPFAEERRLFYVGLTRTKNYVYLLVNKDEKLRSPYINELYNIMKDHKKE